MLEAQHLDSLNAEQLRVLACELMAQVAQWEQVIAAKDGELKYRQAKIDQLTHEMAVLKRWKFGKSGERLDAAQLSSACLTRPSMRTSPPSNWSSSS